MSNSPPERQDDQLLLMWTVVIFVFLTLIFFIPLLETRAVCEIYMQKGEAVGIVWHIEYASVGYRLFGIGYFDEFDALESLKTAEVDL